VICEVRHPFLKILIGRREGIVLVAGIRWNHQVSGVRASSASIAVGVACALKPLCSIETPAPIASLAASTSRRRISFQPFMIDAS
jgi:hypothetical protein